MIEPSAIAFDIDGVLADTMTLFLDIAREEYDIGHLRHEDITRYSLVECLDIDPVLIDDIIIKLLKGDYRSPLRPIPGAAEILTRIYLKGNSPLLFVTARPYLGPIEEWIWDLLPGVDQKDITVVPTGAFDRKAAVLKENGKTVFVDDRLDTCFLLKDAGIEPVLFKQPWNREVHPFAEAGDWTEIEQMIMFPR